MFITLTNIINVLGGLLQRYDYPSSGINYSSGRVERNLELEPRPVPYVKTELGSYGGYFMKVINGRDIYAFEGVAYAEPPERFKASKPKRKFKGIFSALSSGNDCLQTYTGLQVYPSGLVYGREDCLSCNIYSPMISTENKFPDFPVLLFFHGGGFELLSKNEFGPAYLLEKDLVLVTCNYRLGAFGFLSTGDEAASGNWGLKDAAMALDWVHTYIKRFGGDTQKIVLMGQSASAVLVHLLTLSTPIVEDKSNIFGAVCLSGNALEAWAIEDPTLAIKKTRQLALINLCPINRRNPVMIECLRNTNPQRLTALSNLLHISDLSVITFRPVIEPRVVGAFLTDTPKNIYNQRKVLQIPIIFTTTSREVFGVLYTIQAILSQYSKKTIADILVPAMTNYLPALLEYKGQVGGNEREVTGKIMEFYGGLEKLRKDPNLIMQAIQDRLFTVGFLKSLELHSKLAPTFGMLFAHTSERGYAGKLGLNVAEVGATHTEDIFYIFNCTNIKPITKDNRDYEVNCSNPCLVTLRKLDNCNTQRIWEKS